MSHSNYGLRNFQGLWPNFDFGAKGLGEFKVPKFQKYKRVSRSLK